MKSKLIYFVILGILLGLMMPYILSGLLSTGKEAALLTSFPDKISGTVHPIILVVFIIFLFASLLVCLFKKKISLFLFVIYFSSLWYKWLARSIQAIGIPISTVYSPEVAHSTVTRWPAYVFGTKILDYSLILFILISLYALFSKRFSNFERRLSAINVGFVIGYLMHILFFVLPSVGY